MWMYTITAHPKDFPDKIALRPHWIGVGYSEPAQYVLLFDTLEEARKHCVEMGLTCIPRDPADDPVIVESWL